MKKTCCKCKEHIEISFFSKNKNEKDGLNRVCKICQKKYYVLNKDKIIARVLKSTDKERKKIYDKQRRLIKSQYLKNYENLRSKLPHRIELVKKWVSENPEKRKKISLKYAHKRRALQLNATPSWDLELNQFVVEEALELCKAREKETGIKWEIDHIVPMMGKGVCGLHTWTNLQVVPQSYNRHKSNKFPYPEWAGVLDK